MRPAPRVAYGTVSTVTGLKLKARLKNCVSPFPWAKAFASPVVVSSLPRATPTYSEKNCMKYQCGRTNWVAAAVGKIALVLTGRIDPVFPFTFSP
jgi:hypothetical protein